MRAGEHNRCQRDRMRNRREGASPPWRRRFETQRPRPVRRSAVSAHVCHGLKPRADVQRVVQERTHAHDDDKRDLQNKTHNILRRDGPSPSATHMAQQQRQKRSAREVRQARKFHSARAPRRRPPRLRPRLQALRRLREREQLRGKLGLRRVQPRADRGPANLLAGSVTGGGERRGVSQWQSS